MTETGRALLDDLAVRAALRQAWEDSRPGPTGGHEEGGFLLRDAMGLLSAERWPPGVQNSIIVPDHAGCKRRDRDIVATFHTHPNTGSEFLQEPSVTDTRAVRDDPQLKGPSYAGEFVISQETVYLIEPTGHVTDLGATRDTLAIGAG